VYSALQDAVIRSGWGVDRESFQSLLLATTEAIRAEHPRTFQRFLVAGDTHCPGDYSVRVDGVSLWSWIGYLVDEDPRWVDLLED
jgi:hypothetical protein